MIEGNFSDISLPAVLQLLCLEAQKNFRVGVLHEAQRGEIFVRRGWVIAATFGILEGEDAFCEFMSWRNGSFWAEQVSTEMQIDKNLAFAFQPTLSFMQDCEYLIANNVGLNSEITGSILFGSTAWKELVKDYPLDRESLSVLAWLREGRTMHQAMREFGFDMIKSASILTRLLLTKSVDILRPTQREEDMSPDEPEVNAHKMTTGGQEAAAAKLAQQAAKALESAASVAQEAFLSTSFKSLTASDLLSRQAESVSELPRVPPVTNLDSQSRASVEARLRAKRSGVISGSNLPVYAGQPSKGVPDKPKLAGSASFQAPGEDSAETGELAPGPYIAIDEELDQPEAEAQNKGKSSKPARQLRPSLPSPVVKRSDPPPSSSGLQALLKNALEKSKQIAAERLQSTHGQFAPGASPAAADLPAEGKPASDAGNNVPSAGAMSQSPPARQIEQTWQAEQKLPVTDNNLSEREAVRKDAAPANAPLPEAGLAATVEVDPKDMADWPADDPRFTKRTQALPLVALDIERLLQANFILTQFGKLALGNPSLDPQRRQTLLDAEQNKSLLSSLTERARSPASVLSSYRYCLDRGYVDTNDPVIPLTADLLLGRMEIDQYLLQRRRITGDELRDLIQAAREEGIKLPKLLVRSGFLTEGDIETLEREQKRFAFK